MFVTILAAIGVAFWVISFPIMVHEDAIKSEVRSAFAAATGMDLEIQGDTSLKLFPSPHLSITQLYVPNSPSARASFLLTIKRLDIWPVFTSLFRSKIAIKKIEVTEPDLELEALPTGRMNWQDVSSFWQEGSNNSAGKSLPSDFILDLQVSGGHISYSDPAHNINQQVDNLIASCDIDETARKAASTLSLSYMEKPFVISADITGGIAQLLSPASSSVRLDVKSGQDSLTYKGNVGYRDNHIFMGGNLQLALNDLAYWVELYRGNVTEAAGAKKLPLSASADIKDENNGKGLTADITFNSPTIQGTAKASVAFPGQVDVKASISKLNLEDIIANGFLTRLAATPATPPPASAYPAPVQKNASDFDMTYDVRIADMLYNGKDIKNTSISAEIQTGGFIIPQIIATLPGQTRLDFSGIGRTGEGGVTVEGQADAEGAHFVEALSMFKAGGFALPEEDFRRFHIRTNVLLSSKEARLSELQARIENITANGDLIAKYGDRTSISTALLINGLNLDHVFTLWGLKDWRNLLLNYNKIGNNSDGVISVWLKKLGYDILISTSLENYTFDGRQYGHGNFDLSATAGKMQLSGTKVSYKDSLLAGKVDIDVTKNIPEMNMQVDVDQFDPDTFFLSDNEKAARTRMPGTGKWSTDLFDFKWMDLVNGKFDFKIGRFHYKNINADDVMLSGNLQDSKLSIDSLRAVTMGAGVFSKVILTGGTIPTLEVAAELSNIRIERFASLLPFLEPMSGLCNATVRLSTNGVNPSSWVSNMEGSVGMRGRDIEIHGFNLPGIIRAVNYVRTVANILDVVKRAFPGGDVLFNTMEGQWSIAKGVLGTTETKVSNDQADGTVTSHIDLINATMNTSANFVLKALDRNNPPNMIIKVTGDISNPTLDFDTSPLEQYVSNKTSEKLLENYGAH